MSHYNIWVMMNEDGIRTKAYENMVYDLEAFQSQCPVMDYFEVLSEVDVDEFKDNFNTDLIPVNIDGKSMYKIDLDQFMEYWEEAIKKRKEDIYHCYHRIQSQGKFNIHDYQTLADLCYPYKGELFIIGGYIMAPINDMEFYHYLVNYHKLDENLYLYEQLDYHC